MSSNHLTLCCLLLLLPLIFPSIRVFPMSQLITSGGQRIGALASASGLISFRVDWCTVQGTLKNLLQHHSLKASILWCSAFFMVQLSHPCMTTGKTIALTIQTYVGRMMILLFNMLSRFVIDFLPRSKRFLISWLQSPSAVILEPKKMKSVTTSTFSPWTCYAVMGQNVMILVFF